MKILLCGLFWLIAAAGALQAGEAVKIMKVLPHFLDLEGRHSLAPSLYERDAYQNYLRKNPELRSAIRFDIHWKAKRIKGETTVLRLELRTSNGHFGEPLVLEMPVKPRKRIFGNWTSLTVHGKAYEEMGELIAWRATLSAGGKLLAERKSFLW